MATSVRLDNTDDGDLFWQGSNFGQGSGGYNGTGAFTAGAWHRVAAAYDEAATPPVVTKYVDGIFQDDWTANQGWTTPRRAMQPTAILFGDGDQDERRTMWVNSIQIRNGALSKAELAALSAPGHERHSGLHSGGTAAGALLRKDRKSDDPDLAVLRHRLHPEIIPQPRESKLDDRPRSGQQFRGRHGWCGQPVLPAGEIVTRPD